MNFSKTFGKNTYYYLLPKNSKIKKITFRSWRETNFLHIVKLVLKKYNIDYWNDTNHIQKVELNNLSNDTPISSLNSLEFLLREEYNLNNVQETIENVVDKINSKYDAIWYKDTDYYQKADEILIPEKSFRKDLFFEKLPQFNLY